MSYKNLIHCGLKSGWGICQPKRHDEKLIMALMCSKCRFVYVAVVDTNLMVSRSQIQFAKNGGSPKFIKQLIDGRYRKLVFDGYGI